MRLALSSAGSALVHLSALLLITLPSVPLLIALKIRHLRRRATHSPTRQPMDSQDLDDFDPDDGPLSNGSNYCDDPIAFVNTTAHLDRCYAKPATQPSRNCVSFSITYSDGLSAAIERKALSLA